MTILSYLQWNAHVITNFIHFRQNNYVDGKYLTKCSYTYDFFLLKKNQTHKTRQPITYYDALRKQCRPTKVAY